MSWPAIYLVAAGMVTALLGGLLLLFTVSGAIAGALGWAVRKVAPSLLPLSWKQAKENKCWTAVVVLSGVILQILIATLLVASWSDIAKPLAKLLSFPGLCCALLSFLLWGVYGIASIRAESPPTRLSTETEFAGAYRTTGAQSPPVSPSSSLASARAEDVDRACAILGVVGVLLPTPYVTYCVALLQGGRIHLGAFFDEPAVLVSVLVVAASWVLLMLRAGIRRALEGRPGGWRTTRDLVACIVLAGAIARAVSTAIVPGQVWTQVAAAMSSVFGVALAVVAVGFARFLWASARAARRDTEAREP